MVSLIPIVAVDIMGAPRPMKAVLAALLVLAILIPEYLRKSW